MTATAAALAKILTPVQQQPTIFADPKGDPAVPRNILTFRLSHADVREALVHEFSLHDGVEVGPADPHEPLHIVIETGGSATALWDVRATVGIFDDHAVEVDADQAPPVSGANT